MNNKKIQSYSLVELAFLAIFAFGLLMAFMIVKHRARVDLSELLSLPGSGLSVSIPVGTQWGSTQSWQYEESENGMMLISEFAVPGRSSMGVRWRYCFSTPSGSELELLEQKAKKIGAVIQNTGTIGQLCPMVYARIGLPSSPQEEIYLGIMRLSQKRSVELLVRSNGLGSYYPESILRSLAGSIQYQPGSDLADGSALIDEFLESRGDPGSRRTESEEAFLIKDAAGKSRGYYCAQHSVSDNGTFQSQIQQFEANSLKLESQLWLDPIEKEYRWNTSVRNPRIQGVSVYKIAPAEDQSLLVTRNEKEIKIFPPDQFFLPEPLLNELAGYFLETEYADVIVDVLSAKGHLVPVRLTKISLEQANAKSEDADSVVRIVFLHARNSYEELVYDASGDLLGKFEQTPNQSPRIWDVVSVERLQQIFQDEFQLLGDPVA